MPIQDRRAVALAFLCLVAVAFGGCGRRGPLEPPAGAAATAAPAAAGPSARRDAAATPTTLATRAGAVVLDSPEGELDEEDSRAVAVSPSPTPRRRGRAYDVPKEPFILDALL